MSTAASAAIDDPLKVLGQILALAVRHKASDIHMRTKNHPILRVDGVLRPIKDVEPFPPDFMERLARTMMTPRNSEEFDNKRQVDLSIGFKDIGRVRANIFYQRGSIGMVLRVISSVIPSPQELGLPDIILPLLQHERGLVLFTGATGSGKSTSLAALLNVINVSKAKHIITIEDPIEFLFTEKKCIITQREIGIDTNTFADAMRAAMREDPDVILLGEMRDPETIETALTASETGHLVLSTVHSPATAETISRIVTAFPPEAQQSIRAKISQNLRGIISQRLVPMVGGTGRTVATEVMTVSALCRELILDPIKMKELGDVVKKGTRAEGMISFDNSLYDLVKRGTIDEETALQYASSPTDLKLKLEGF